MTRIRASEWQDKLLTHAGYYISEEDAARLAVWISLRMPLIIQGPAGSGKTTLIEAVNTVLGWPLYRLSCYDSITSATALYRWNEPLQRLAQERLSSTSKSTEYGVRGSGFSEQSLTPYYELRTPYSAEWFADGHLILGKLAQALAEPEPDAAVLIDEVDKVPEGGEFENSLLEFLDRQTITINESKTILRRPPGTRPLLIGLTSNAGAGRRRRRLSEPVQRRCMFMHLPQPSGSRIREILHTAAPGLSAGLLQQASNFVERTISAEMEKPLSIAEAKQWVCALQALDVTELSLEVVGLTAGLLGKTSEEIDRLVAFADSFFDRSSTLRT